MDTLGWVLLNLCQPLPAVPASLPILSPVLVTQCFTKKRPPSPEQNIFLEKGKDSARLFGEARQNQARDIMLHNSPPITPSAKQKSTNARAARPPRVRYSSRAPPEADPTRKQFQLFTDGLRKAFSPKEDAKSIVHTSPASYAPLQFMSHFELTHLSNCACGCSRQCSAAQKAWRGSCPMSGGILIASPLRGELSPL